MSQPTLWVRNNKEVRRFDTATEAVIAYNEIETSTHHMYIDGIMTIIDKSSITLISESDFNLNN